MSKNLKCNPIIIKDWEDLSKIPKESPTHILEVNIDECNGWLISKNRKRYTGKLCYMRQLKYIDVYLSTHTFYESEHKRSSKILRACGFNVELESWG